MSDDAPALVNAMRAVFGDNVEALMCWVHVWRAVMAKCASLGVKDDKTKRTLFTDLAFIHNLVNVDLVTHALQSVHACTSFRPFRVPVRLANTETRKLRPSLLLSDLLIANKL